MAVRRLVKDTPNELCGSNAIQAPTKVKNSHSRAVPNALDAERAAPFHCDCHIRFWIEQTKKNERSVTKQAAAAAVFFPISSLFSFKWKHQTERLQEIRRYFRQICCFVVIL